MATGAGRSPAAASRHRLERTLLAGCDAEQAEAITTPASPLCVLAGAGSGKTRVLTRRIAWRVMDGSAVADHVLALTFTRKAAAELRSRLGSLGMTDGVRAGTFHAVALNELKHLAAERRVGLPAVVASKLGLLAAVTTGWSPMLLAKDGGRSRRARARSPHDEPLVRLVDLAQEIEWAKARCLQPVDYERAAAIAGRLNSWPAGVVSEAWEAYELEKRRRRVLDFEDLLLCCAAELEADVQFAASARWRTRHLFVDEYQDVNAAQLRLLRLWLGDRDDLCVVGDPDQAIYSWNGSDPAAISRFASEFPRAVVLRLGINYRSTREVLTVAAAVLGQGDPATAGGPASEGAAPTITAYHNDLDEAEGVAAALRLAKRPGRSWSQLAVLARTNAQLHAFERALTARHIPHRTAGSTALLQREAARAALRDAGRAANGALLASFAADLRDEAGESADLREIAGLIDDYLAEDVAPTGARFCDWVDAAVRAEGASFYSDTVTLSTFHRSKGLEWPVVFLTGLEAGLVPIAHAKDPDALAEERRLLYVACTRAAEELHCSFAEERTFSAKGPSRRTPSPWLGAIEAAARDLQHLRRAPALTAREAIAASRRLLGAK